MNNNLKVGYKNPPAQTQFKKGQTGNPKGRTKGSKSFASIVEKELKQVLTLKGGDKISKMDAIVKQVINDAVMGDPRKTKIVLDLIEKSQKSSLAEKFLKKLESEEYMKEEDVLNYVNGHIKAPKINKLKIRAETIRNVIMYAGVEWISILAEVDVLFDSYEESLKILATIYAEFEFWDGVEQTCDNLEMNDEEKIRLIKKLEKTRVRKRPTNELLATAINLPLKIKNRYNILLRISRFYYKFHPEYSVMEKKYFGNSMYKDFIEKKKENLKPQELEWVNNYIESCKDYYKDFMKKVFEDIKVFDFQIKENINKLISWYEGGKKTKNQDSEVEK